MVVDTREDPINLCLSDKPLISRPAPLDVITPFGLLPPPKHLLDKHSPFDSCRPFYMHPLAHAPLIPMMHHHHHQPPPPPLFPLHHFRPGPEIITDPYTSGLYTSMKISPRPAMHVPMQVEVPPVRNQVRFQEPGNERPQLRAS